MTNTHCKTQLSVLLVAALAGCSAFNPYQRSDHLHADLLPVPAAASGATAATPATAASAVQFRIDEATRAAQRAPEQLVGDLPEALAAIADQRNEWFGALSSHARTLNGTTLAMLALTGWGLYEGLKPGFVDGGTATDTTRRHVAKAAIGTAGAYALGNFFLNAEHDQAYIEGYKALTCLIVRTRPYALTTVQWRDLALALRDLEAQINVLDRTALKMRVAEGVDPRSAKSSTVERRAALSRAESALRIGRLTLERGQRLLGESAGAGGYLRRQGELVVTAVAEELRRNNKQLTSPEQLFAGLQGAVGRFQSIEPVDRAEEEDKDAPTDGEPTTAAPTEGAASAATQATQRDLAQLTAAFARQLDDLKAAMLDPKAAKAAQAASPKRVAQLEAQLEAAKKAAADAKAATPQLRERSQDAAKLSDVGDQIATLYEQRRHVNAALVTHDEAARRVKQVRPCRGAAGSALVLLPGEDKAVERGKAYEFRISGAKGQPLVTLDGDPGTPPAGAKSLLVALEGGLVVVTVSVGANAPAGKLRLIVHDPAVRVTEDVVMSVPAAPKK
jgi:hypothetical protein